jgi:hypothetical protein
MIVVSAVFISGCSTDFWNGSAAVETIGPEADQKEKMKRLEEDFEEGRVSYEEYLKRKRDMKTDANH